MCAAGTLAARICSLNGAKLGNAMVDPLVYLVDDDDDFREEVVSGLIGMGLSVIGFESPALLYRSYATRPSDIIILDIGLDGESGLSVAAHLRSSQQVGIIMVTARGAAEDRIRGIEMGADAYLVKPVSIQEIYTTVIALNERMSRYRLASRPLDVAWSLLDGGWVLSDGIGHHLRLTAAEQRLLECLFSERGQTVSRHTLVEALGEDVYDFNYNNLDTIISRLRRRAKKVGITLPLHAVRGIGFVFSD